ncbi:SDR family oxidoreductase [Pedobacter miscanthi]|uniref:Short-chain dehydrogenase n=1 Tax=Pedobacter miscanthi TaxID=2259170 RepID=A0A366L3Z4_9SPHI|nr:SDR family oxidoreductase [Pedobacter miscanthi]RBQ07862.1 short-chain dehydrogenase [Pedobacter miscanthi]
MKNKIAIITGASQGIGRATALRLAEDFKGLVLVARNMEELEKTAGMIGDQTELELISADLRESDAALQVVGQAVQRFGRIDALINIAGAVPQISVFDMTDAQWNDGAEMKLHGARRLTIAAWPFLKQSGGSVVFTSGSSAAEPKAAFAAVAVINAAIVALAKAFADTGKAEGIQVNSLLPGAVMSNRRKNFLNKLAETNQISVEEASQKFLRESGIPRYGEPAEIANLIAFMVSADAQWMTGSAIRMDGGEIRGI